MSDLDRIRHFLASEGIHICFNGPFRHSIIEELGLAVRRHLEVDAVRRSATADVFSVFIEAAQNVSNYANRGHWTAAERAQVQNGVLVIGRRDDHYIVQCGNYIDPRDAGPLLGRLDALSAMDKAELKAAFKERMHAELPPGAQGAGLGLIRMARAASRPLSYAIGAGEAGLDFFSLTVQL
jgi:hypothetical protein